MALVLIVLVLCYTHVYNVCQCQSKPPLGREIRGGWGDNLAIAMNVRQQKLDTLSVPHSIS